MTTPPVSLYYHLYILNHHSKEQLIWHIAMSGFTVCTFMPFLCLACDGPISSEGSSAASLIWDSGMLASLPSGVCQTLEKMGVMAVLHDSGFEMSLGYMIYCRSLRSHGFPTILTWLKCPRFCSVVRLPPFVEMRMARPLVIELYTLPPCVLYEGTLLCYRLFRCGCFADCLSTTSYEVLGSKESSEVLGIGDFERMRLMLKSRVTGTFPTCRWSGLGSSCLHLG